VRKHFDETSARLSVPSPMNFTSSTSFGISHVVAFSDFTFWSKGFLSVRRGCMVS
jgi:hypothetical protein